MSEPLELDRYGVPAAEQEEVWRQVRLIGMLVGYLEEAVRRGDLVLITRYADMIKPAYDKLSGALDRQR